MTKAHIDLQWTTRTLLSVCSMREKCAMKTGALAALVFIWATVSAHAQMERYDALANSPMVENRPTAETAKLLKDELLFQRATQIYLWALPLINTLGMKVGSEKTFGAGYNVLPVWKKRLDAKTLVTTPNSDVIYAMSYLDVGKDGPMVFEAPAGLQGILLDFWQRPIPGPAIGTNLFLGDVGFFGPDGGKGGKFLILPPGYDKPVPDGYFVYRSGTNNVFVFLRSFYQDPNNLTPAVALMESAKIYPLGGEANAKPMEYPDASGVPVNMLAISDGSVFDQLKILLDSEGGNLADPDWRGMLASIGIIQRQSFSPDAHARTILDLAAKTAYKTSRVIGFEDAVGGRSYLVYSDRRWLNPIAGNTLKSWRGLELGLGQGCGPLSRPRRPHLVLHRLLFDQSRNDFADTGQGCEVHDRFYGQQQRTAVRRSELPPHTASQNTRRELLVGHTVRRRKRFGPSQRSAISVAWLARQANAKRRWLDRSLSWPESARRKGE
jgi:hypothetical protein